MKLCLEIKSDTAVAMLRTGNEGFFQRAGLLVTSVTYVITHGEHECPPTTPGHHRHGLGFLEFLFRRRRLGFLRETDWSLV